MLENIRKELKMLSSPKRAKISLRFFKTGRGEYGEGDIFIGIRVPELRALAKKYAELSLQNVIELLKSPVHEERMIAVLLLIMQYRKGDEKMKKKIFHVYTRNTKYINNWDLIDVSAEHIVGAYLAERSREVLFDFAKSKDLWKRRIAIMATFHYIKQGECADTLEIAELLIADKHDLIQKAVGWMLREVGNRCSLKAEEAFLKEHLHFMPRTMLRYAIEKFPERKRSRYLKGRV